MAGICINHVRRGGGNCDHRDVTVTLDGQTFVIDTGEGKLDQITWDDETKKQFILLGLKRLRALGLALDDVIGRCTNGEEATNVKQYALLTQNTTKTNIGTAYVNIPIGLNGERTLIEFTGCTEFRLGVWLNLPAGTIGPLRVRIVRDSDSAVLYESPDITTPVGEKEFDSGILPLPPAANALFYVRLQGKSITAADDPIFRKAILLVR